MADGNNVQIARSLTSTIRADCSDSDWTRPVFMLASAVQIVGTCHSTGLRGTASHNYASTMSLYRPRGHGGFRSRAPVIAVCIAGHRSRCLRPSSEARAGDFFNLETVLVANAFYVLFFIKLDTSRVQFTGGRPIRAGRG